MSNFHCGPKSIALRPETVRNGSLIGGARPAAGPRKYIPARDWENLMSPSVLIDSTEGR